MAGTCAEYDWQHGVCSEESTPINPRTLYGVCKESLQKILFHLSREQGLSSAWGRLFHNWESTRADECGYPEVAETRGSVVRSTLGLLGLSMNILMTCIREAPEVARRRRKVAPSDPAV